MRTLIILFSFVVGSINSFSQDTTLLKMLDDSISEAPNLSYVKGTFNGSTVLNLQSIEQPARNVLEFVIMHRLGKLNAGSYNFFGLDGPAHLRLGLNYGITNRLTVGAGRSDLDKTFDASIKYKLLRQTEQTIPVSLGLFASLAYPALKYTDKPYLKSHHRKIYTTQIIAARKFNKNLSLEITPTWVHFNLVPKAVDKNDIVALGMGGRMKLTKRMSINAEYDYVPSGQVNSTTIYNSFSTGIEFETGGHVFQLIFTNSDGMVEPYYLAKTSGSWGKGDIYFGFNISRVFNLKK
jgi:hypothetical protein